MITTTHTDPEVFDEAHTHLDNYFAAHKDDTPEGYTPPTYKYNPHIRLRRFERTPQEKS
jgi:hypothetical protein